MSQGDGWSENTSEAVRVCQHKSNKNPSLGLHPPPQTQVMALFLIPEAVLTLLRAQQGSQDFLGITFPLSQLQ